MKNNNSNLQDFLQQLKDIDVAELLEKAKSVKVEDIRSLRLSDLKKLTESKAFYPTIGTISAALIFSIFLVPAYQSLRDKMKQADLYASESLILPEISDKLDHNILVQKEINEKLPTFKELVATQTKLISVTELLYDAANRSLVEISEFSPVLADELLSCSSLSDEEQMSDQYDLNNQGLSPLANDQFSDDQEALNSDQIYDDQNYSDQYVDGYEENFLNAPTAAYEFNPPQEAGRELFTQIPQSISNKFTSNYYSIRVRSDYINILNFLRAIQEYKIVVVPFCFEPRSVQPTYASEFGQSAISNGEVEARFIFNIPSNSKDNQTKDMNLTSESRPY